MKRNIVFSNYAENSLIKLIDYLEKKWSIKVKNEFISKLDKTTSIIQNEPEIFPKSKKKKNIHRGVITKQTTIYYRFSNTEIRVLALFDTRKNPTEIKNIK